MSGPNNEAWERVRVSSSFQEYERVVMRMPGVISARVYEDVSDSPRVHILGESYFTPRQVVRQVVSLLRNCGWNEIQPEMVTVVQIQDSEDGPRGVNRLRVVGYTLTRSSGRLEARCRLGRGVDQYEGAVTGTTPVRILAEATVSAVNDAIGRPLMVYLNSEVVEQAGVSVVLVLVRYGQQEVLTGSAVIRDVLEEAVVRAALDAVNRRVVLYSGGKSD